MAKWIICENDESFYKCSNCNEIEDWRYEQCPNCGEDMEDTENINAEWGEYKATQCGGNFNVTVWKNGKYIMHAQRTERMTEKELTEYLKDFPEFLEMLSQRRKKND